MSQEHERMVKALQEIVVTGLRDRGFKGSFPHFRRPSKEKIDLLTFQFDRSGGGFIIEISKCPPNGITTNSGEYTPPNKITAWHMHPDERLRLQPRNVDSSPSDWFRYDKPIQSRNIYEKVAKEVLPFIEKAEDWWKE